MGNPAHNRGVRWTAIFPAARAIGAALALALLVVAVRSEDGPESDTKNDPKKAPGKKPETGKDGDVSEGSKGSEGSRLDATNKKAAARVARTFAQKGRSLRSQFRGLTKEDVIVVGGLFDFVQELLVAWGCPHTVIRPSELEHVAMKRPDRMVFLLNCHLLDRRFPATQPRPGPVTDKQAADRLERALKTAGLTEQTSPGRAIRERFKEIARFAGERYSQAGLKRMAQAVKQGAWVYSNDWAVLALERAFPGRVRWTKQGTFEETIEVQPALAGRRHPLVKGLFPKGKKIRLWLETESYLFTMKGRHTKLIQSRALGARYQNNRNVVSLFAHGKGRVMHSLVHGYLQKGKTDDAELVQKLLVRYLIQKSIQNFNRPDPAGSD